MKAKVFFLTILIISLYSCCPKDGKTLIPLNSIESWIPFQKGDKFFFTNENNDVDSIWIDSIATSFQTQGHWCTGKVERVDSYIKGVAFSDLHIILKPKYLAFFLHINNKHESYFYRFNEENTNQDSPEFYSNIEIGNSNYTDVIGLNIDSLKVYYGKDIGIIGYKIGESTFVKN